MYNRTSTSVCAVGPLLVCAYILSFQSFQICSTLSDLPSAMVGSAAVACLLVREGADLYCRGNVDIAPIELCMEEFAGHLVKFKEER